MDDSGTLHTRTSERLGQTAMIVQGRLLIDPEQTPVAGWVAIDGTAIADLGEGATWRDDYITHRILKGVLVAASDLECDLAPPRDPRP